MNRQNVEDLYNLSPLQEGMLFHALYAPGQDAYVEQSLLRIGGRFEAGAFARAWQTVVDRTPALRTAFVWEGVPKPLQVVFRQATLETRLEDWRHLSADAREERLRALVEEDRSGGLPLQKPPLLRVALARLDEREHAFLLTFHHALLDGWSIPLVLGDVFEAYDAEREGRAPVFPPRRPYRDYVVWLKGRDRAAEEAFWRRTLAGIDAPTPLWGDRDPAAEGRPPATFGRVTQALTEEESRRVVAGARSLGVTVNTLVQAAWGLTLAKGGGGADAVFGATVSGRPPELPGVDGIVGLFINTLPVRVSVPSDGTTVRAWIAALHAQAAGARQHEHTPLVDAQAWSEVPRGRPLFESLVAFENYPLPKGGGEAPAEDDLTLLEAESSERTNYALSLAVLPGADLRFRLTYDADRFEAGDSRRLLETTGRLLREIAGRPDEPVAALSLLTPEEAVHVVLTPNRTAGSYERDAGIHQLFEARAAETPESVAVQFEGGTLSYAELNARANRLARHLRAAGVGAETPVGVAVERSAEMVVALLAVLKAGGAYVPLDASYPAERLRFMLEEAGVACLVVRDGVPASLEDRAGPLVSLARDADAIAAHDGTDLVPERAGASPGDALAYVMFTSGSTGTPKGVAVPHRAVVRLVRGATWANFGPCNVFLQLAPLSFDASTLELWAPLLNGGKLVVAPPRTPTLAELGDWIRAGGVSTLWLTAGLFHQMVDAEPGALAGLRQLLAGGDVLSPAHVRRVLERLPGVRLINGYGPTENTTFTCTHAVTPADADGPIPVGRAVDGTRVYVLDAALRPIPFGVPGELCAAGDGLARGYVGRPELTAERFVDVELPGVGRERIYRTGDRARMRPDGVIEFLGRADEQVKIRGFRVEPGEVEAALAASPGVARAVVTVREDAPGDRRLVGYVVPGEGHACDGDSLRDALRATLPEHLVPSAVLVLPELPLTPNGKVDRRALPVPERTGSDEHVEPRTETERALASIWSEVLAVPRVGATDDFFALGGHSLLATQVAARVRKALGVDLPLRDVFESGTLERLAARVDLRRAEKDRPLPPPLEPAPRDGPLPLSYAQERLWFVERLAPGTSAYNVGDVVVLPPGTDEAALARALEGLVRRHESLRTTFAEVDDAPVQVIHAEMPVPLAVTDLRATADPAAGASRAVAAEMRTEFDLRSGPLLRARLLRVDPSHDALVLTMHHIVGDGWSLPVLRRELRALYEAALRGEDPASALPPLRVQYADFAVWQRAWLSGDRLRSQLAWWRETLGDAPPVQPLTPDLPRPAVQSFRGAAHTFAIPRATARRLAEVARREGATPFMAYLAVLLTVLHRWSGEDDLVVGTTVAGRTVPELEPLIGFFVNTPVLRADLGGAASFRDVLARVREATLGAFGHQDVPFERVVEALGVERSLSHHPLFQVMFTYQAAGTGSDAPAGAVEDGHESWREEEAAKFDLALALQEGPDWTAATLTFATDLFRRDTARRLARHFLSVAAAAGDRPSEAIVRIPLVSADEELLLRTWSEGPPAAPGPWLSVADRIAENAVRTPQATAVVWDGGTWTYAELDARADALARTLVAAGIGREDIVAVSVPRGPEMVAAVLAAWKTGAAYLPVDPAYPADRRAFMLADSGARAIITHSSLTADLPSTDAVGILVDDPSAFRPAAASVAARVEADSLAAVIYTSGSTGRPKGVAVPHRGLVNLWAAAVARQGLLRADRILQWASLSFDAALLELLQALATGAELHLLAGEETIGEPLVRILRDRSITVVTLPPSLLATLAPHASALPSLRLVMSAAEACPPAVVEAWAPGRRFQNGYGPTETTVCCALAELERAEPGSIVPLGRPAEGAATWVVDAAGQLAAPGIPGELWIGGEGVTRGYVGRPALTAERFVPDPFSGRPGARLYRSGDRVRWTAGGELEFLGRFDFQVKVRGFRIELGEIETALRASPGVRDALVLAREDRPGDRRLVGYVVHDGTFEVDADAVRRAAAASLPAWMVPSAIVVLDAFPRTPNGKVDRRALPAPERTGPGEHIPPRTPAEEVMAELWRDVLGLEQPGVTDRFFEVGGHSLLATRLVSRIREAFGVELPLRAVFETPALGDLAAAVEAAAGVSSSGDEAPIPRREGGGPAPASFAQERLWFLDQLQPGDPTYNLQMPLRLRGVLDAAALERALAAVVERHEPLRTRFVHHGDAVLQEAVAIAGWTLPIVDLTHLPPSERAAEADRLSAADMEAPFDLAEGPPFRATLLRLATDEHLLLLNAHHVATDGWSQQVLMRELFAAYVELAAGRRPVLPPLPVTYADWSAWQRAWLAGPRLQAQLDWWRERLAGAPPLLTLPTDRPRAAQQSHRGGMTRAHLSPSLRDGVHALAREAGASPFMVYLAAFQLLLGRLAGQEDVVVGTPIAGRTRTETEGLIGLFLNSLALRADLSGTPAFRALLARVRETTLGAFAHQDVPFERLLEALHPERSLSHAPLFQVMFNLLNFEGVGGAIAADDLALSVESAGPAIDPGAKFDLTLYAQEAPDGVHLHAVHDADLFDGPRIDGMLEQFRLVLEQVVANPDAPIDSVSLVTDPARALLPSATEPLSRAWRGSVGEVFDARAADRPDAVAVEDPVSRWTYAELAESANRIAHALVECGVRDGDVVAIWAHRSAPLVRALLGVLKSGGAFLCLDPSYPPARLAEYIRIARPAVFVRPGAAVTPPRELLEALEERSPVVLHVGERSEWVEGAGGGRDLRDSTAPGGSPRVTIGPDTLAYLSFTSGTTGTPKAVRGRHGSLTHFTPWLAEAFALTSDDRFSLLSGLAHDPLHRDVLTPLQLGAAVVAPDPEELGAPGYLARWMGEKEITVTHLTPAMGQVLSGADTGEAVPSLRRAFFVGDLLTRADVERLHALAPNVTVVNYYGSTETQRAVSYHVVRREAMAGERETIPLGRGIPGVQLLVRNASGGLCGIGEVGEVWLRSPHVALGYLGDASLTAARFVRNPWTDDPADVLYRTGDLGRYRPDGEVEPLGRADGQVKVRGFRVELGEIEAALGRHPDVREAVVVARGDGSARRLIAYVVPASGDRASVDVDALRGHVRAALPDYMVPAAWMALERLPLTANAKVDRNALPEPDAPAMGTAPVTPPATPTERALAAIWREVLSPGGDGPALDVGRESDFFALGGHSLLAMQVLARVRRELGTRIPVRTLFVSPTLAGLADAIDGADATLSDPSARDVERLAADGGFGPGEYPLSFAQQRLWLLDRLDPGSAAYNLPGAYRLRGGLDVAALERALGEIVRRHETLRTRFVTRDGAAADPIQRVDPPGPFALSRTDITAAELDGVLAAEANLPFDLTTGPLFRARLLRIAPDDHVLAWTMHHVVSDGWSTGIFLRELTALYDAFASGRASPLPELAEPYGAHALRQRAALSGAELERQVAHWKRSLAGAPTLLELPTDRPRPAVQRARGATVAFAMPDEMSSAVAQFGRAHGATPFMVYLTAFAALLARYARQDDLVVGTPIANRATPETERLIGFFANTLALRTDLREAKTFGDAVDIVRAASLSAFEHPDLPFEKLVEELQPERSLGHSPVFQVMFALQNQPREDVRLGERAAEAVGRTGDTAKYDLSLTLVQRPDGGTVGAMEYATDLFDAATIERMLGHLAALLEAGLREPHAPLRSLPLMTPEERARMLAEDVAPPIAPGPETLHGAFEDRARMHPDATALVFEDRSWTYGELDADASRIAARVRAAGGGIDVPVGICLEPTPRLVAAILGVLKAGGAFLPLDPTHPSARLAFLLADSGARLVLTDAEIARSLPETAAQVVLLDDVTGPASVQPPVGVPGDALAYVIYTSGSTGTPKGVGISHRVAAAHLRATQALHGTTSSDVLLQFASPSFDLFIEQTMTPLSVGAAVVLRGRSLWTPAEVAEQVVRHGVTILNPPTAYWTQIANDGTAVRTMAASLRLAVSGGEAMPPEAARRWRAADGGSVRLINAYGPTECAVTTHAWEVPPDPDFESGRVPIGTGLAGRRTHVLSDGGEPCPTGVPGELHVGGMLLARGYLGRPSLTAERFLPDPFAPEPGARLYRTGDLVRRQPDGALEFLGRADAQVKVRGFRIEPGEVEAVLARHPSVREAAVVARPDASGALALFAFVAGDAPDPSVLREHLRASLPDPLLPSAIVVLEALPLTPNGKVDRRALPDATAVSTSAERVPPRTPVEEIIAEIWMEVLARDAVGVTDDFFSLGGHSLLATRVMARVEEAFEVRIPLRTLFERPTVEALAEAVEGSDSPVLAAMLADLEGLTDEELAALLEDGA